MRNCVSLGRMRTLAIKAVTLFLLALVVMAYVAPPLTTFANNGTGQHQTSKKDSKSKNKSKNKNKNKNKTPSKPKKAKKNNATKKKANISVSQESLIMVQGQFALLLGVVRSGSTNLKPTKVASLKKGDVIMVERNGQIQMGVVVDLGKKVRVTDPTGKPGPTVTVIDVQLSSPQSN